MKNINTINNNNLKAIIILFTSLLLFSCKKEQKDNNCIGCNECTYTNYYLLKSINAQYFSNNIIPLDNNDTCVVSDFSINLILNGDLIIESAYNEVPNCIEKKFLVNKFMNYLVDSCPVKLKPINNQNLIVGEEIGYSPIKLAIDTNNIKLKDTTILFHGNFYLVDFKGNVFRTILPHIYIKIL